MNFPTLIQVKKNGYSPPTGLYRLVFPYLSTLKKIKFEEQEGKLGTVHDGMFYPMDSLFWAIDGNEIPLKAIRKTQISGKLKEKQIIIELDEYYILPDTNNTLYLGEVK